MIHRLAVPVLLIACSLAACHRDRPASRAPVAGPPADTTDFTTINSDLRPDSTDAMLRRVGSADSSGAAAPPPATMTSATGIGVVQGLRLTSANHFPDGDRENVVTLAEVSPEGVLYSWHYHEQQRGAAPVEASYGRLVSAADLAGAPRLNQVFSSGERTETPGYTAMSLSRATYARLLDSSQVTYTVTSLEGGAVGSGLLAEMTNPRIALRGTLARAAAAPESMAVLVDGRPTELPVFHLRGAFAFQEKKVAGEYWVLADSADPLILRELGERDEWRMIRIDRPAGAAPAVEGDLERICRAELPGVYFGFASADLEPESDVALAGVADLLGRHPDWSLAIEGHTDSIGGTADNQALSERRADAVRSALVARFHVAVSRLASAGFGATRPRESNATLEGRARNRRVEVVRKCAAG